MLNPSMLNLDQLPLVSTLIKGGPVMLPLLAASLLSFAVILERLLWGPSRSKVIPESLINEAYILLASGKLGELQGLCRANNSPLARVLLVAIKTSTRPRSEVLQAVETVGKKEAYALQKYLAILSTIAALGPLLGLLGTVLGMISTFKIISEHGSGNPSLMAAGIAEALITTASGLAVAIPALLFHRFFLQRVKRLILEMEVLAMDFVDELSNLYSLDKRPESQTVLDIRR